MAFRQFSFIDCLGLPVRATLVKGFLFYFVGVIKNMNKNDYKQIYSKGLKGLSWDSEIYDIHHIDLNHNNNDFRNLVLIPKRLHRKFHFLYNGLKNCDFSKISDISYQEPFELNWISNFFSVKSEMKVMLRLKGELLSNSLLLIDNNNFDKILSVYSFSIYSKYVNQESL